MRLDLVYGLVYGLIAWFVVDLLTGGWFGFVAGIVVFLIYMNSHRIDI